MATTTTAQIAQTMAVAWQHWEAGRYAIWVEQLHEAWVLLGEGDELTAAQISLWAQGIRQCEALWKIPALEMGSQDKEQLEQWRQLLARYLQGDCEGMALQAAGKKLTVWLARWRAAIQFVYAPAQQTQRSFLSISADNTDALSLYATISPRDGTFARLSDLKQRLARGNEMGAEDHDLGYVVISAATNLLMNGYFEEAKEALEAVVARQPQWAYICNNSIGVCCFYMRRYEAAIDHYIKAMEAGEAAARIEYNVWEACRELYWSTPDRNEQMRWVFLFKEYFPDSQRQVEAESED